jgi:hypothetical protein
MLAALQCQWPVHKKTKMKIRIPMPRTVMHKHMCMYGTFAHSDVKSHERFSFGDQDLPFFPAKSKCALCEEL